MPSRNRPQIDPHIDLDGVLADFDGAVQALGIDHGPDMNRSREHMSDAQRAAKDALYARISGMDFFRHLPLMPGALDIWTLLTPHYPTILTAVPRFKDPDAFARAAEDKYRWVCDYIAPIPRARFVATTSREKPNNMRANPGHLQLLIDDRKKNIEAWQAAGGTGVLHVEASATIAELNRLLDRP